MASTKNQMTPELEFAQLEINARAHAQAFVAKEITRPDQLDKVEQIRKRISSKKSSVEAMLKTSIQSQLDGVRTGLNQLQNALRDIQEVKKSLSDIEVSYRTIAGLSNRLDDIREENSRHSQLGAAVENMKHIFTVPETVKKCREHISEGKLLHAHKCLTDLESSRDELLFELHKQPHQSPTDVKTITTYFGDVEKLSEELGKQLWLILQRTMMTARREPTIIVTCLRIIEREDKIDEFCMKRYDQQEFLPPGRPKRWRAKCFQVLEDFVRSRIEGNQMEDRTTEKMWLVRHLEVTRQLVVEDLKVVKTLCDSCFPPHYNIVKKFVDMYHNGISEHLQDVIHQGLESNEIVSLLMWVGDYTSKEFLGNPDLVIDTQELSPLLDASVIAELQNEYIRTLKGNISEWMNNSLSVDVKDWNRNEKPEADERGFFNTQLPIILFQMIEQNLQVAKAISEALVHSVLSMVCDELGRFVTSYRAKLNEYREAHLMNRNEPKYYLDYMIANINNCMTFEATIRQVCNDNIPEESQRFADVAKLYDELAQDLCDRVLEEVFMDVDPHVQELLTRKWVTSAVAVDTICITVEDYCQDFVHLKDRFFECMLIKARNKLACQYLKAMFSKPDKKKITFKSYDERAPAADKICREAEQLTSLFMRLLPKSIDESPFDALRPLAEMVKLRDTSMISFEISTVATKFPDIRVEQLVNVLMMREDVSRGDAKAKVIDSLGEDHDLKPHRTTILSKLYSV